jgi:hypothetical protein
VIFLGDEAGRAQQHRRSRAQGRRRLEYRKLDAQVDPRDARRRRAELARELLAAARDHPHECGVPRLAREKIVALEVVAMPGEAPWNARDLRGRHGERGGCRRPVRMDVLDAQRARPAREPERLRIDEQVRQQMARVRGQQQSQRGETAARRPEQLEQRRAEYARRPRPACVSDRKHVARALVRDSAGGQQRHDAQRVSTAHEGPDLVEHERRVVTERRVRRDVQQAQRRHVGATAGTRRLPASSAS